MDGPFLLPDDVGEGDWIEIGQLGAYGAALRTAFNGFDRARLVDVCDPPLLPTPGHARRLKPHRVLIRAEGTNAMKHATSPAIW